MSEIKTGGPAFPTEVWDAEGVPQHTQGMTLRDYFAAKAMQTLLQSKDSSFAQDAEDAYIMADEMLKARER
jgi:hypothetical protein